MTNDLFVSVLHLNSRDRICYKLGEELKQKKIKICTLILGFYEFFEKFRNFNFYALLHEIHTLII